MADKSNGKPDKFGLWISFWDLLIAFAPSATIGGLWVRLTGHSLSFSFTGLVIASLFYSLPFAVQPLQAGGCHSWAALPRQACTVGGAPGSA